MTAIALRPETPLFRIGRGLIVPTAAIAAYAVSAQIVGPGDGIGRHSPVLLGLHIATVIPALPLGGYVLWSRKGNARHKLLGRIWAMLMMITAIASLGLRSNDGAMSPIHIFSFMTLISIPLGIYYARIGNIAAHIGAMRGPYIGMAIAGVFAFAPGRILGALIS
jgi:uncharacterized membrane protein